MNSKINSQIIKTLVKKEMLDVFRDKKTVLMMLVIPIILYPLIFFGAMQLVALISSSMKEQNYRIVADAEDGDVFLHKLMEFKEDEDASAQTSEQGAADASDGEASDTDEAEETYEITIVDPDSVSDYETALNEEEIDVYVSGQPENGKMQYEIYYLSSETNSSYAANLVMDVFDALKEDQTKQLLAEAGMDVSAILEPIGYEKNDTASSEQSLGSIMGSILPFMLVISLLMGTMYPAIDTTAGERERGTLETVLTLPVTNRQLIVSKFITVAVIGMMSVLLNLLSMGAIAFYMYGIMDMQTDAISFDLTKFIPDFLLYLLHPLQPDHHLTPCILFPLHGKTDPHLVEHQLFAKCLFSSVLPACYHKTRDRIDQQDQSLPCNYGKIMPIRASIISDNIIPYSLKIPGF